MQVDIKNRLKLIEKKINIKRMDIKLFILITCFLLMVVSIIILWNNDNYKINLIFDTVLISLLINIISSILLIYFIDERDKKKEIREKNNKENVIYKKLISIIKEFNNLVINLYKSTMNEKINENDKILSNLYYDIDRIYTQINKVNIYKKGYKIIFYGNKLIELNWKDCFVDDNKRLLNGLKNLLDMYSMFLPSNILEELENIIQLEQNMYIIENDRLNNLNENIKQIDNGIEKEIGKVLFEIIRFKDILIHISNIMNIINNITEKNNFKIDILSFNADNISPQIGSGL